MTSTCVPLRQLALVEMSAFTKEFITQEQVNMIQLGICKMNDIDFVEADMWLRPIDSLMKKRVSYYKKKYASDL